MSNQYLYYYYSLPINIRQSASTTSNATIWGMRNQSASTKLIFIDSIQINMAFDSGTPLTRSLQRYDFIKFSTATPTGGTVINPVAGDTSAPASQITDSRFLDTGLTTTGLVFGTSFLTLGVPATDSAIVNYQSTSIPIILAAGEGLCIRLNNNAVVGQSITGFISWSER